MNTNSETVVLRRTACADCGQTIELRQTKKGETKWFNPSGNEHKCRVR